MCTFYRSNKKHTAASNTRRSIKFYQSPSISKAAAASAALLLYSSFAKRTNATATQKDENKLKYASYY